MTLLIIYPEFYGIGGIARYLDNFLNCIPPDFKTVYLLTGDEGFKKKLIPNAKILHIPYVRGRLGLLKWGFKARKATLKLIKTKKINQVNIHLPPLIPCLFLVGIPYVLTAHTTYLGMTGKYYKHSFFKSPYLSFSFLTKFLMEMIIFRKATRIIVLTEQGKNEVRKYANKIPIKIIPNGTDIKLFTQDNSIEKEFDIIFSGRIEKRKGSDSLIQVCEELTRSSSSIKICILGYGDDFESVHEALSQHGHIFFTGQIPFNEVKAYYNKSKIYVSTSYYEGLPGTCIEAMSMGLPAVTWDFEFYAGLVVNNKTGFIAETNNIDAMTKQIRYLLSDDKLRTQMGNEARRTIQDNYNWKNIARRLINAME